MPAGAEALLSPLDDEALGSLPPLELLPPELLPAGGVLSRSGVNLGARGEIVGMAALAGHFYVG
jgi:hypothetical protein